MTPKSAYQQRIASGNLHRDKAQENAIEYLEKLHTNITQASTEKTIFTTTAFKKLLGKNKQPVTGIYLWGGVGRGKTWLMDLFFETLPFDEKIRLHFHRFMQAVHDQLSLLKGHRNPLAMIAQNFSQKYRILCLDEFHVSDITDAMLLYGLLDALFKEGVTLVVTSNQPADELYKNGLQRERFLPAIELIKQHTRTLHVDGDIDHRLRLLEKADTWYDANHPETCHKLRERFAQFAPCKGSENQSLHINYRNIESVLCADDVVWFEFDALCAGPRAAADYIEIAKRFHTLFLSNVPILDESLDDKARRFINLVDEFYDRNVKLIISAAELPANLYQGSQLEFEFQRTISRLEEMRSHDYLARPHRP